MGLKQVPADGTESELDTRFFGHPRSLGRLFGLEMWERFSYYGMTGVLAIYLYFAVGEGGLGLPQPTALAIVGAYGGAVFLATIAGAWAADRLFGAEHVLFWSAAGIMAGHIVLALVPGIAGLSIGLILVALGSGGLKANAASIVGDLYELNDPRREAGFSIFYMGVNIGAFAGPLVTGLLQKDVGFHPAFGAAAIGMAIGLVIYWTGRKNLPESANRVANPLPINQIWRVVVLVVVLITVIVILWMTNIMNQTNLAVWIAILSAVFAVAYFVVILSSHKVTAVEKSRTVGFIPFFLSCIVFWSLYQQLFGVLTSYSETQLNRSILGWEMPINWIQLISPAFVIILAPVFSALWLKLGDRQPSTPVKSALALIAIGAAFLLFIPYANAGANGTPLLWIVFIIAIFVCGELLISPIGLALTTKLAPKAFTSQMLALYFLASGVGTALSGVFATYYDAAHQVPYWLVLGGASIAIGCVMLALAPLVLKLMKGVR